MLNENGIRMLAYTAICGKITPIEEADRIELMQVNGWHVIIKKGEFKEGDMCIYFEIDSKLPKAGWSEFMEAKGYKVKTMKLSKFGVISQGLALPTSIIPNMVFTKPNIDCTQTLGVTYSVEEDNKRKAAPDNKKALEQSIKARHKNFFKSRIGKFLMRYKTTRAIVFKLFSLHKPADKSFPTNRFAGVSKTDQERCENMTWVLEDKTPFIVTQKCDGSSGTYILERKGRNKFEFYVCSRNVRMLKDSQKCYYGDHNYYWEVAEKCDIYNKMKAYLMDNPKLTFVCWQGEICAPGIQKNPHKLKETHFYCFHWTDDTGRWDIRKAKLMWERFNMEVVPIVDANYILPDDFEEFKKTADGFYNAEVCEGNQNCPREGYVYYKTTDPTFSFKNVSREYLLKHNM